MSQPNAPTLPDGLVVFLKRECETCRMVAPLLAEFAATVYTQDDPAFPDGVAATHDATLALSWHHDIETVPTLIRVVDGVEVERTVGWLRSDWQRITGIDDLGDALPVMRPGCGSLSVDPDLAPGLAAAFGGSVLKSRRLELADRDDEMEMLFDRGYTDGLPVVPPTEERVLRMLEGTHREPNEIVTIVPPDLVPVTIEKIAVNAVMAGCKPEYLPWVIAAVEAVCTDEFNIHGVLATTMPVGPVIVCNGPGTRAIGMNGGGNAMGQGNRANLTIGRAVQLVIRNVGGGVPARSTGRRTETRARSPSASPSSRPAHRGRHSRRAADSNRRRTPSRCSQVRDRAASSTRRLVRRPSSPTRSPHACAPCTTRSWSSASTPCSWWAPSTLVCSPTTVGTATACSPNSTHA